MLALDLFAGGGGAAFGLIAAGFDVVGMDIESRHASVYPGDFIVGDALRPPVDLAAFDFIWASPPCQAFSPMTSVDARPLHANLIPPTQAVLRKSGRPYAIENVRNAIRGGLRPDLTLEGGIFGLRRILRRRVFEISFPVMQPPLVGRVCDRADFVSITTSLACKQHYAEHGRLSLDEAKACMGLPASVQMDRWQIGNAVPPPYARYIGGLAIEWIRRFGE